MSPLSTNAYRNELLRRLSADDLALLKPHIEPCSLPKNMYLERHRKPIEFVYFPEEGIASTVAKIRPGQRPLPCRPAGRAFSAN
jgi:hypothetical protein